MASRNKRVMKEIQDCQRDSNLTQIHIKTSGEDLTHLCGTFPGPPNSPYEGGTFEVAIEVPTRYPFEPLKMKFNTKVYHPNVSSQSGAICLDILKDAWSPVLTLKTTLVSLQSLLCSPEPNDPQDAEVANVYLTDRTRFERTARHWTEQYAGGCANAELKARSSTNDSTKTPANIDGIEVISSSTGTNSNPTGGSTSTASAVNSSPFITRFTRDNEDRIQTFALSRDQINQFQHMGFEVDSIITAMVHVRRRFPHSHFGSSIPHGAVLEGLLNPN